jgi:hypothetical protein
MNSDTPTMRDPAPARAQEEERVAARARYQVAGAIRPLLGQHADAADIADAAVAALEKAGLLPGEGDGGSVEAPDTNRLYYSERALRHEYEHKDSAVVAVIDRLGRLRASEAMPPRLTREEQLEEALRAAIAALRKAAGNQPWVGHNVIAADLAAVTVSAYLRSAGQDEEEK